MQTPILDSWQANARQWIALLEAGELETRKLVTNKIVVDTVLGTSSQKVLDAGCGEGWLCRHLVQHGVLAKGVDGIAELIEAAKSKGGDFDCFSFEQLVSQSPWPANSFDCVVFNFCLYEEVLTTQLLKAAINWVPPGGYLVIQTLYPPAVLLPGDPYENGWKTEAWAGLKRNFSHPYRWYFRTIGSWCDILTAVGWALVQLQEPLHPITKKPASLVLTGKRVL